MTPRRIGLALLAAVIAGCAPAPKGNAPRLGPLNMPTAEEQDLFYCERAAKNVTWKELETEVNSARQAVHAANPQDRAYQVGMRVAQKLPDVAPSQVRWCCRGTRIMSSACAFYSPQFWGNP